MSNTPDMPAENEAPQKVLNPALATIRACSFNPGEHMIPITFKDGDAPNYYLEVKWRLFWFHQYCQEKGYASYSVEESPATIITCPSGSFVQTAAVVKIDGEVVGQGIGGVSLASTDIQYAVQQAATIAKGRALANAGFGCVFTSAAASESGGSEIPCDSGLNGNDIFIMRNPENPLMISPVNQPKAPEKPKEPEMTRDTALKFVVKVKGPNEGKTLGELMAKAPNSVRYFAENMRFSGTELQKAAKLVLNY